MPVFTGSVCYIQHVLWLWLIIHSTIYIYIKYLLDGFSMLRNILDALEWKKKATINLWFVRAYGLVDKMYKYTKAKHMLEWYILTASVNQVIGKNAGKKKQSMEGVWKLMTSLPKEPFSSSESRYIFEKWNKCVIWKIMENCQCSHRHYTILLDQQHIIDFIWYHQAELTLQYEINWNWENKRNWLLGQPFFEERNILKIKFLQKYMDFQKFQQAPKFSAFKIHLNTVFHLWSKLPE